jgi:putative ABC transport system permease protein
MILLTIIRTAIRALKRNLLRTLLTMLGIIIGVGAVIAMVSIGNGAKAQVEAQIASLGQNVLTVFSGNMSRGGFGMGFGSAGTLGKEDYYAIQRELTGINGVSPEVRGSAQVVFGNQNYQTSIMGGSVDYLSIRAWKVKSGDNFTDTDVRNANKVCILGATTANQLFGEGSDPVGQIVRIKNAPYSVVGLLARKGGGFMGSDQDDTIIIPWTSAMKRLTGGTTFRTISMQAIRPDLVNDVQQQLTELLRQRHRIPEGKDDDFTIRTQQEFMETATATSTVLTILLGSIASVSLLVGGIGIMNIMLVSVTERTREIGIRMAVGARSRDILLQFLTEAVVLSLVGGLVGILLGVGGSHLVTLKMGWATLISSNSIVMAFMFSAAIGIFFGFYPARKAGRLDPIDALRYE